MFRQSQGRVIANEPVNPSWRILWLSAPAVAQGAMPGQFAMLRCSDGLDPLLPRPLSYHRFRNVEGERQIAFLYRPTGRGTSWLAQRQPGERIELFGPLGRGFAIKARARNLLLLAGGIGIASLVALADEALARGRSVALLMGARTAQDLFPLHLLPPEVEVALATDDGSAGYKGPVTDLLPSYLPWADQLFACGPAPMFAALAQLLRRLGSRKPTQILLEERMACGTGICYGCAVETRRGVKLVCRDGPCFELWEVF